MQAGLSVDRLQIHMAPCLNCAGKEQSQLAYQTAQNEVFCKMVILLYFMATQSKTIFESVLVIFLELFFQNKKRKQLIMIPTF